MTTHTTRIDAGARLRVAREQAGLTLAEVSQRSLDHLADGCFISSTKLYGVEHGTGLQMPSAAVLCTLCHIYELALAEVLAWYGLSLPTGPVAAEHPLTIKSERVVARLAALMRSYPLGDPVRMSLISATEALTKLARPH
jgi:transcriptional regulator with XRE-family HTH domain